MITEYLNKGVCSKKTIVELAEDHTILDIKVIGGCNGNLQGITRLLKGMKAEDAMARMKGISCNGRPTSCPDQISIALGKALESIK